MTMRPSKFPVVYFFVLVFAVQGVVQALLYFAPMSALPHILSPYLANPSVVGLLMILWLQGFPGIRRVLLKLLPWPVAQVWPMLALCLLLPLACAALTLALVAISGGPVPPVSSSDLSTYLYVAVIEKGFLGPGLIEEIGWRGFALPYLQRRYSALASSLIIGLVWALWHFPMFIAQNGFAWWQVTIFIPQVIAASIIFTWVYNTTGGNLLACILLHGAINAEHHFSAWSALPDTDTTQLLVELPLFCIAASLLCLYGPSNLSRSNRVVAQNDLKGNDRLSTEQ
jgi:uncharacterized protein